MDLFNVQVKNGLLTSVYLALLSLGVYLIYAGDIIQKYQQKLTNFAEYGEEVSQLPTILAYIEYNHPELTLEFGKDFNLTYQSIDSWEKQLDGHNLTRGFNKLENGLQIEVLDLLNNKQSGSASDGRASVLSTYHNFKITPISFFPGMKLGYALIFDFGSTSGFEELVSQTGLTLTSEDNAWCNTGSDYMDGGVVRQFGKPGEINFVEIAAEKYKYLQDQKKCRIRPFNKIVAEKISTRIYDECSQPCRPNDWYCKFGFALDNLTICQSSIELECFNNVKMEAKEETPTEPCTKIQYKTFGARGLNLNKNQVFFSMVFQNPPKVTVKEEYLIYDGLAVIGGIGGTLGICVGFSFNEFFRWFWHHLTELSSVLWKK